MKNKILSSLVKKLSLFAMLLCITTLFSIQSCKKKNYQNSIGTTPSLNQLFSPLRYTPQSITVNAGRDTIVYGANGTMLHFYTYSFKDGRGNIITSGTVNLQLIEMYKPVDMICNRTSTITTNGQILESAGEVNITATINGEQVYANKYGIGFKQNGPSTQPMALYYNTTGNTDSLTTWTESDNTQNGTTANATITDSGRSRVELYTFDTCNNFSWVNGDFPWEFDSAMTTATIIFPDTSFNPTNTELYLIFPIIRVGYDTLHAVLSYNGIYDASTNKYTLAVITQGIFTQIVPEGVNYELVLITNKNGQYYYYQQSGVIPQEGLVVGASMVAETLNDIQARMQNL